MDPTSLSSSISIAFGTLLVGLIMLVGGGESLVSGATRLAKNFGMSSLAIGLTVVAFGTSVPELFVSLTASLQGYPDIMIGNVVGSNIANVGLILGCCSLLATLPMNLNKVWIELTLIISGSLLLMACSKFGIFPRSLGLTLVTILAGYTYLTYKKSSNSWNGLKKERASAPGKTLIVSSGLIFVGLALLAVGSTLFIRGAVEVARFFGVSELVIGLTLAAIGTSLPELASSLAALRRKAASLLIGNVIGSNLFNLFMVLGLTGMLKPFALETNLLHRDLPVMLAFTLILIPMGINNGKTKKWHGALLLTAYGGYCLSLI